MPKHNVLGEIGQGYKVAIETLNEGRIGIGAQMVGVAQEALDAAITYAKQRRQFGKTIAEFQRMHFSLPIWPRSWRQRGCWCTTPHA